ncbi:MAG: hypothetical protein KC486_21425 [Myxococcales bacterium]|nr:hypothetical protein [Myxococcales bacterium]
MTTPPRRPALAAIVSLTALATACATFESPQPRVRPIDSRLHVVPVLAAKTSVETPPPAAEAPSDDASRPRRTTATHAVLWTGVVLASLGGAGLVGFGAAGLATNRKLDKGLLEEGISRDDRQTLVDRGETLNTATIVSASVGLLGALMAVTAYGVEYTNCGPLAPKRRRCSER